jgi:superfamily II DNA or RNA helicase
MLGGENGTERRQGAEIGTETPEKVPNSVRKAVAAVAVDNSISRTQTDWVRAEDLFEAVTARVGIPGCTLWPHQASAIIRVRDAYADGARRIMLQLPTGGGKTRIAGTIIRGVRDIDRPALVVVPAIELVDQEETGKFRAVNVGT